MKLLVSRQKPGKRGPAELADPTPAGPFHRPSLVLTALCLLAGLSASAALAQGTASLVAESWDRYLAAFVERIAVASFLIALISPFLLPVLPLHWAWCLSPTKRSLLPAVVLAALGFLVGASFLLPGGSPLMPGGFRADYLGNTAAFQPVGLIGGLGAGAPLKHQTGLILIVLTASPIFGGGLAWLIHYLLRMKPPK